MRDTKLELTRWTSYMLPLFVVYLQLKGSLTRNIGMELLFHVPWLS